MYFLIFLLANFINQRARLIHLQVTIFISLMSWYCGSIIVDTKGYPKIDRLIVFERLLFKICELEKEHIKVVSKIDLKTKTLVKGEYELLLKRSKILVIQEDYDVVFDVVTDKLYGSGSLVKIKELFSGPVVEG